MSQCVGRDSACRRAQRKEMAGPRPPGSANIEWIARELALGHASNLSRICRRNIGEEVESELALALK